MGSDGGVGGDGEGGAGCDGEGSSGEGARGASAGDGGYRKRGAQQSQKARKARRQTDKAGR